jgi:hypothetical protein
VRLSPRNRERRPNPRKKLNLLERRLKQSETALMIVPPAAWSAADSRPGVVRCDLPLFY